MCDALAYKNNIDDHNTFGRNQKYKIEGEYKSTLKISPHSERSQSLVFKPGSSHKFGRSIGVYSEQC